MCTYLDWLWGIFLQHLEKHSQVLHMFVQCGTGNQMVIQVSEHKREMAKEPIHQPLVCLSCVHETKRHEQVLKQTERGQDGGLCNVCRIHGHLVVPLDQINDREKFATMKFGWQILQWGQGIPVMDGGQIQLPVVATWSPRAVLLWDHVEGRRPGWIWPPHYPSFLQCPEYGFRYVQLIRV